MSLVTAAREAEYSLETKGQIDHALFEIRKDGEGLTCTIREEV